jgi:hypothetical protein
MEILTGSEDGMVFEWGHGREIWFFGSVFPLILEVFEMSGNSLGLMVICEFPFDTSSPSEEFRVSSREIEGIDGSVDDTLDIPSFWE